MKKNLIEVIHEVESQSGNDEQEEPIIHGFKHTAFQYQSEKNSFKFSKDRWFGGTFEDLILIFEIVLPLQSKLSLQEFLKESV